MTNQPAVFARKCSTCIFHPGNRMHLAEGRLQDVVESNLEAGTLLVCHTTLFEQADREVLCRGFYDAYKERTSVWQIYTRMGGEFEEVDPDDVEATSAG